MPLEDLDESHDLFLLAPLELLKGVLTERADSRFHASI
jgi:hypothetical protein